MSDQERGLYNKFHVERCDGSAKHRNCEYFVLDMDHDKHAARALLAYADSCEAEFPILSEDLRAMIKDKPTLRNALTSYHFPAALQSAQAVFHDDPEFRKKISIQPARSAQGGELIGRTSPQRQMVASATWRGKTAAQWLRAAADALEAQVEPAAGPGSW